VLPDTTTGRDVRELIRAGILSGVSFGFTVNKDSWAVVNNEKIRTLESVTLYEISPTANPAYPDTSVALRNLAEVERSEARRKQAIARIKLMKWNF
jgi:HK97 family phage prohead protease